MRLYLKLSSWSLVLSLFASTPMLAGPPRIRANQGAEVPNPDAAVVNHGEVAATAAENRDAEGLWRKLKNETEALDVRTRALKELDSKAKFLSPKSRHEFADYVAPLIIKRDGAVLGERGFARMELLSQLGLLGAEGWPALDALLAARKEALYVKKAGKSEEEKRYAERIEKMVSLSVGRVFADRVKKGNRESLVADLEKSIKEGSLFEDDLPVLLALIKHPEIQKLDPENLQIAGTAITSAQNILAGKPKTYK